MLNFFLYPWLLICSLNSRSLVQRFVTIQDAVLRRLRDDDLSVVQAALNLDRLSEFINSSSLLDALQDVLQRCISNLTSRECSLIGILDPNYLHLMLSRLCIISLAKVFVPYVYFPV